MPEQASIQHTPADIVAAFYAAITEHQPDRIAELAEAAFDEDIWVELPASLPYGGRVQGARRLSRMFQAMAAEPAPIGPRDLRLDTIIDGGDGVAARVSFDYRRPDGTIQPSGAIEEWTFRDGRAVAIRAYYQDTTPLVSAAAAE